MRSKSLLKAIAVTALSLYPVAADNYHVPSHNEQAYAAPLPPKLIPKKSAKLSYPLPVQAKVGGKEVLVYDFPLEDIAIDVLISKKPQKYSAFVAHAQKKYGSKLEFLTSSTFYHGGLIGRIFKEGKIVAKGKSSIGLNLVYSDEFGLEFRPSAKSLPYYTDVSVGGLASLVKEGRAVHDFSNRKIRSRAIRERIAIGVRENGTGVIACATSRIKDLAEIMEKLGCEEAAAPDGGGKRLFYYGDKVLKRPEENIAGVIIGYKR